jgi:GntR family transcriptional regulator, arabinose operon transcriptional repressor
MAELGEPVLLPRWPKYLRIKQDLTKRLRSGQFDPNVPLPSEKTLAELGGVSVGTVRQALSELAEEGLVRREQGRGTFVTARTNRANEQAVQRQNAFALIAPQIEEGYYPSLVRGFEEATATHHYQLQVGNSRNDVGQQASLILGLLDQMVGGVAIVPPTSAQTPAAHIRQLRKNHIPIVYCHRAVEGVAAPCVTFSGYDVGFKAGQALYKLGHRRMAFLLCYRTSLANEYERGLVDALRPMNDTDAGTVTTIEYGVTAASEHTRNVIQRAISELLGRSDRPTAFFCGNVTDAEQVYLQVEAAGIKVPRDASVMSFGGIRRDHGLSQRMSGVAVDEQALGARAAQLLHEMCCGKRALDNDEQIVFPITLYDGETLGPAPAGSDYDGRGVRSGRNVDREQLGV